MTDDESSDYLKRDDRYDTENETDLDPCDRDDCYECDNQA